MRNAASITHAKLLWPKIEHVRIGMFTTVEADGQLASRPMTNQQIDSDGCLWFFASNESSISHNIALRPRVNIAFAEPEENLYVSVSGLARQVSDPAKIDELWSLLVAAWFPQGQSDPRVVLIKVEVETAEYWDAESNKMVQLFRLAKAALSGETPGVEPGEHAKFGLPTST